MNEHLRQRRYQRIHAVVRRRRPGFSLLELMVAVAILSIILSIGFTNFVRARGTTQTRACVKQIRTLDAAKTQYAMARRIPTTAVVSFANLIADGLIQSEPTCPTGFTYTLGTISEETLCTSGLPGHTFSGPY